MAKEFKLEITFDAETKDCKVTGPLRDPDLCLLGLEMARRVLVQMKSKRVIVAPFMGTKPAPVGVPLPNLRKLLENGG